MQPRKGDKGKRKPDNAITVDQCGLYKLGSTKRLAATLGVSPNDLSFLLAHSGNYKCYELAQSADPFTRKGRKKRAVQEPKQKLRRVHGRILKLLRRVSYPDYVHGCVKYRSYQTNAAVHRASRQTATFDISDFYASTKYHLVHSFFNNVLCCPTDVAGKLATLTTCKGALPTGSPLSPLLSFWVAKGMFDACAELAKKHDLKFSCYMDDLTFSGDRVPGELKVALTHIVRRYGYELAKHKTKVFRFGVPAHITGVITLRSKLLVPHKRLEAIRKVEGAIEGNAPTHGLTQPQLRQKLAGLTGEAATIEQRFAGWAAYARDAVRG